MNVRKEIDTLFNLLIRREFVFEMDKVEYRLQNVPIKKAVNYALVQFNRVFGITKPLGYPYKLQVEPVFGCNLKCPGCPAADMSCRERKMKMLSLSTFRDFIDQTGDYALFLTLWAWGEPFLNRHLPEMIALAKKRHMVVITSTNGNLLQREDYSRKILESGLDALIIAVDGTTQKTYETYRKGGNIDTVLDGVKRLVEEKRCLGIETPLVNLRMVVTRYNEHEIEDLKAIGHGLGVDVVSFKSVNPSMDGKTVNPGLVPVNKKYQRYAYSQDRRTIVPQGRHRCFFPWTQATFFSEGDIVACEFDNRAGIPFGNVNRDAFRTIWFGKKFNEFRKQFTENKDVFDFCEKCAYKNMIIDSCTVEAFHIRK